jgi:hypothetical protein
MKLLRDQPTTNEFALQSGKLIQNFGVVELISYRWIEFLSGNSTAMEISMELPLSKRIDIIIKLLKRDLGGWTMLVMVEFPSAGCWKITGEYLGQVLDFVVEVQADEPPAQGAT